MNADKLHLCRICLETDAKIPIFDSLDSEDCNLLSKLTLCFNEVIQDLEGYPRNICFKCNNTIETVVDFINQFKSTCKILAKGLSVVKDEIDFSEFSPPEVRIEIDNIKTESDCDNQEESLPLMQLKLKGEIKKENFLKSKRTKRLTLKAKSTKSDINNIASAILEGDFAWIGDVWCVRSINPAKEKKVTKAPTRQKEIKIIKPKERKIPQPPPERLCDICGEVFKDQDKLNTHKKNVHYKQQVKCPKCPRLLVSEYYLSRHVKRAHDAQARNIVCPTCGRGFAYKGELTSHIRNVHNKHLLPKKTFVCKICNKTYKCAKSVLVHERSAHTGQRPAVCDICGTSFFHEDYLREHRRLHTGETPYKCPICNRGYAQRCNMKSHLRIHRITELDATALSKIKPNYLKLLKV